MVLGSRKGSTAAKTVGSRPLAPQGPTTSVTAAAVAAVHGERGCRRREQACTRWRSMALSSSRRDCRRPQTGSSTRPPLAPTATTISTPSSTHRPRSTVDPGQVVPLCELVANPSYDVKQAALALINWSTRRSEASREGPVCGRPFAVSRATDLNTVAQSAGLLVLPPHPVRTATRHMPNTP